MRQSRGEPLCPRCGATNLTYKNVFDYYKCNDCGVTFITPVFSYGEVESGGLNSAKDVASKIFGEARLEEPEKEIVEPEPPPTRERRERRGNSQTWLIILLLVVIVMLTAIIVWQSAGNQITDLFGGLLSTTI